MEIYQRGVSSLFVTPLILCLVGLCLLAALVNGSLLLTVLCLLVFAITAILRLWAKWGASHIRFGMELGQERLFPDESLPVTITAHNTRFLPLSFEVHSPVGDGLRSVSGETTLKGENVLLWYQSLRLDWELVAKRRGVHPIGPVTAVAGDLLGFFVKESTVKERCEVIVYPRLVPLHPLSLPKRDFFGVPGGESPVDDPVYILGTIDYHHGRPARHIHWKASARHNRLQQKVFEPTEQEKILLVVDVTEFCNQSNDEAFEKTLETVASLAARFDRRGSATGFLTNGTVQAGTPFIPVTRNPFQIGAILETLARMEMRQEAPVIDILRRGNAIPWGTTCIYVFLEANAESEVSVAAFSRRRTPVVLLSYQTVLDLRDESLRRRFDREGPRDDDNRAFGHE